jgi:Kef-type K+ transport system membrane component KefB
MYVSSTFSISLLALILGPSKLLKRRIGMKRIPIVLGFLLAGMGDEIDECIGPRRIVIGGNSVTDDIETVFGL